MTSLEDKPSRSDVDLDDFKYQIPPWPDHHWAFLALRWISIASGVITLLLIMLTVTYGLITGGELPALFSLPLFLFSFMFGITLFLRFFLPRQPPNAKKDTHDSESNNVP